MALVNDNTYYGAAFSVSDIKAVQMVNDFDPDKIDDYYYYKPGLNDPYRREFEVQEGSVDDTKGTWMGIYTTPEGENFSYDTIIVFSKGNDILCYKFNFGVQNTNEAESIVFSLSAIFRGKDTYIKIETENQLLTHVVNTISWTEQEQEVKSDEELLINTHSNLKLLGVDKTYAYNDVVGRLGESYYASIITKGGRITSTTNYSTQNIIANNLKIMLTNNINTSINTETAYQPGILEIDSQCTNMYDENKIVNTDYKGTQMQSSVYRGIVFNNCSEGYPTTVQYSVGIDGYCIHEVLGIHCADPYNNNNYALVTQQYIGTNNINS